MTQIKLGVIGTYHKEHESRVAIHPAHLPLIPENVRGQIFIEEGYGTRFGVTDEQIASYVGGVVSRDAIFEECDVVVLPKPVLQDFQQMREGGVLWGWAHVVQQRDLAQASIDRRLTLITWEAMNTWTKTGDWLAHIFYKNNEIAGYAGIQHALQLTGRDGYYGPPNKAAVINLGSVSRGAIYALQGRGYRDITVYVLQPPHLVFNQVLGPKYVQIVQDDTGRVMAVNPDGSTRPLVEDLAQMDLIVNGILQDTDSPLMFVQDDEVEQLKKGTLIVDISCDEGMGFPFAKPTSFSDPMFEVDGLTYYAVDHTPSYMWDSASWEISKALLPFLPTVLAGREAWEQDPILQPAIEIRDGHVINPKILTFQNRSAEYPHPSS